VEVTGGSRWLISQNQILDSDGIGLRLESVQRSLISSNLIRDDRAAEKRSKEPSLLIEQGVGNQVSGNLLSNGQKEE